MKRRHGAGNVGEPQQGVSEISVCVGEVVVNRHRLPKASNRLGELTESIVSDPEIVISVGKLRIAGDSVLERARGAQRVAQSQAAQAQPKMQLGRPRIDRASLLEQRLRRLEI